MLGACGGVWLSVRGQHPYTGPSGWAVGAPLLILGLVGAALAAAHEDWRALGAASAPAVAVVAAGSAYAGSVNAWLAMGVGLFVALLGNAIGTALLQRA